MTSPAVTIVITSRNRRDEVLRAIDSCFAQEYEPLEVILYDDASDDDSADAVVAAFPKVRVIRHTERRGLIVRRNEGFRDAIGEYVFSLDDDAYFTDPQTVSKTVEMFAQASDTAAIALPYVERGALTVMRPAEPGDALKGYIGCAHAVKKEVMLELGGYKELLVHQGEERDMCLRLIDRGWRVAFGNSGPIVHLCSAVREQNRIDSYGYRNTILITWFNVPQPFVLPRMLVDSLKLIRHRFSWSTVVGRVKAVLAGWRACVEFREHRRPISGTAYRKYCLLPGHGPIGETGVEAPLPLSLRKETINA